MYHPFRSSPSSYLEVSPLCPFLLAFIIPRVFPYHLVHFLDDDYHILRRRNMKTCHKEWFNNIREHDKGAFTLRSTCINLRYWNTPRWTLLSYPRLNPNLKIEFSNHEEYFHASQIIRFGGKMMPHWSRRRLNPNPTSIFRYFGFIP